MTGRTPEMLKIGYDSAWLPLMNGKNVLAALIMRDAHWIDHGGVSKTLQGSRSVAWIINGAKVSKSLVWKCQTCRLERSQLYLQRMAPLPESRFLPAPPFRCAAIDLFGPLVLKDAVKQKATRSSSATGKAWGLMIVCQSSSAVAIEVLGDYSMDAFMLAFSRFCARYGSPEELVSDQGTQLVAAAKELESWDWEKFGDRVEEKFKIKWKFVPVAAPWMNGQSERHIGIAKKLMSRQMGNHVFTVYEMFSLFAEVESIMNSKPYISTLNDPSVGQPLTPQHLLGPRASRNIPGIKLDGRDKLKRRFMFVQECVRNFWNKYKLLVYPNKIPFGKWSAADINLKIGDVVQVLETDAANRSWKLATVEKIFEDSDKLVRKVEIQRIGTDKTQEVPVHRLSVVVRKMDPGEPGTLIKKRLSEK